MNSSSIAFNFSPRNATPIKIFTTDSYTKTPLRSHNSSPSHRRCSDVLSNALPEETKKFHEHILKLELEKEKIKSECEISCGVVRDLEAKLCTSYQKIKKKDEKIKFLTMLLKETETQFKIVLENTNRDLEKIIQEQALKIKELSEALKTQQKELSAKWDSEKNELASKIAMLEDHNSQRLNTQAEFYTKMIMELNRSIDYLQKKNTDTGNVLQKYLNNEGCEDEFLRVILTLVGRIKNEVEHLKVIIQCAAKDKDLSLSMILLQEYKDKIEKEEWSEVGPLLQHVLLGLNSIRTIMSDAYAERYGESCRIQ